VAVNLAPADLFDQGLPLEVSRILDTHALPAEALKLEVSENVVVADLGRTVDVLARLREDGVGICLDDFGAGQSSLAHLRQLCVDELKIDRSFVLHMAEDEHDAAIVHSTVDLAGSAYGRSAMASKPRPLGSCSPTAAATKRRASV
jgi:EAL domain-containing protein (putative c-di-GMP-specific phosphodiesterase class I)